MPLDTCSSLSSHTVFPLHPHTTFSFSHTPALLATTPITTPPPSLISVLSPVPIFRTIMPLPTISQTLHPTSCTSAPLPLSSTSNVPNSPCLSPFNPVKIAPIDCTPLEMSPVCRRLATYFPFCNPVSVTSSNVILSDNSINLANPLTGDGSGAESGVCETGVSRMQTAALLALPEPRRMAGRPVDWMVEMMAEGAAVAVVVRSWVGREKEVSWMPWVAWS